MVDTSILLTAAMPAGRGAARAGRDLRCRMWVHRVMTVDVQLPLPRLVLVNGPPAAGKSTLARTYADEHPPALALDVDVVRTLVGGRRTAPAAAGTVARELALTMARVHLEAGHDVVVPQLLARPELADRLGRLAGEVGAAFGEVLVDVPPDVMARRFARRSADDRRSEHRDAALLVEREGGPASLGTSRDGVLAMTASRPHVLRLLSRDGDPAGTYRELLRLLDAATGDGRRPGDG